MKKIIQLLLIIFFCSLSISHDVLATETPDLGDPETYRIEEYRRQWGLEAIKAADAYSFLARNNKPVAGDGVLVGISDSGLLNYPDPEFTANDSHIHFDNESLPDGTHGSFVTSVAVGVKNGSNTHGVAYNSKFMMARSTVNHQPLFNVYSLAESGAKVINISGSRFYNTRENIAMALNLDTLIINTTGNSRWQIGDYKFAGGIVVHSIDQAIYGTTDQYRTEFNIPDTDYVFFADPDHVVSGMPQDLVGDQNISHGKMIIVGAVGQDNNLAPFSDICGKLKDFCMVAPGVDIYATQLNQYRLIDGKFIDLDDEEIDPKLIANLQRNEDGSYFISQFVPDSGTSFAAPHVTGATAVLRGAWPQLSAETTVQILLTTATDIGAPGVDEIYGHGILNLSEAVRPQGQTIIPS